MTMTLADDKIKQTIVRHIVGMCFDLGVDVIAEGIETPDQETMLQGLGCHLGQGYLYSRPVPLEDFERGFLPRLYLTGDQALTRQYFFGSPSMGLSSMLAYVTTRLFDPVDARYSP